MSWLIVARKDFQDAVRSYWLWGLAAFFTLLISVAAAILGFVLQGTELTSSALLGALNGFAVTSLVPLIAFVMAYGSVVGERESGSLKLLLALPHSRADVVFGKVLGRSGAIVVPVFVGFLLPAIVLAAFVPFEAVPYVGFMLLVALLATVFVSIAVGVSAAAGSQRVAIAGLIGFYFLFVTVWGSIQIPLRFFLLAGGYPDALSWIPVPPDRLIDLLRVINPTGAFKMLSNAFLADLLFAPAAADTAGIVSPNLQLSALFMLVFWFAFPLLVGTWRFESIDL